MTAHAEHLQEIRDLCALLARGRQDYDFQPPALVSHVQDHAADPHRLRAYAKQVICGRIMILLSFSRMNTQRLIESYLLGVEAKNPFPMLLAARSQLELLSVVADTVKVIEQNSGEQEDNFVQRALAVDESLINATFATRSSVVKQGMSLLGVSKLRVATDEDQGVLKSKNVQTRLERLSKGGKYPECLEDYERLCEYVHPNYGMNMLHVVPSPVNPKLLRFSLTSDDPFQRALVASSGVMARAARETLSVMEQVQPPFGMGTVSYLA